MANTSKGRFPSYGLVRGPLHSQGGVPASVANGPDVELEGGEYIIPKEAVPDYLPVLQQITQVGRDRQQMQNGNTAIDALIASASMQNGIAQPKSPMYQEGGRVSFLEKLPLIGNQLRGYREFQEAEDFIGRQNPDSPLFSEEVQQRGIQAGGEFENQQKSKNNKTVTDLVQSAMYNYDPQELSRGIATFAKSDQGKNVLNKLLIGTPEGYTVERDDGRASRFVGKENIAQSEQGKKLLGLFPVGYSGSIEPNIEGNYQLDFSDLDALKALAGYQQGGMIQYEDGGELDIRRSPMPIQSSKMLGEDSIDSILAIINQGKRNGVNVYDTPEYQRYAKSYNSLTSKINEGIPPAEGELDRIKDNYLIDISTKAYLMNELIKSAKYDSIGQIKDDFINLDLKDTMPKMKDGGEVHSRRMYNQGTGFNKKKSDLNGDGSISEYERKRGMAIAKSMGNMQMGGMVNRQPMMQRPMNPAMNFSPMQQRNPRMYQDGGQVQTRKQQEMRNPELYYGPPVKLMGPGLNSYEKAEQEFEAFMDSLQGNQDINPFTGEPIDTDADKRRLKERMKKSKIPRSSQRMPMEEGGQVQLRRQAEKNLMSRQPKEKMDVIFPFSENVPSFLYPDFIGPRTPMQNKLLERFLDDMMRNARGDKKFYIDESDKQESGMKIAQEGGMVSNNNLMGSMASDQRIAALQPDIYQSKSENGVSTEQRMEVPKLAEAILPIYGLETPLSKNQGSMLRRNNVPANVLNPQVKGLINRVLVQRLSAESN